MCRLSHSSCSHFSTSVIVPASIPYFHQALDHMMKCDVRIKAAGKFCGFRLESRPLAALCFGVQLLFSSSSTWSGFPAPRKGTSSFHLLMNRHPSETDGRSKSLIQSLHWKYDPECCDGRSLKGSYGKGENIEKDFPPAQVHTCLDVRSFEACSQFVAAFGSWNG